VGVRALNRRAVFLDRDGVINEPVIRDGRPHPPDDVAGLILVPRAKEALERLHDEGFLLIVVSNQPDIARGTQSRAAVDEINAALQAALPLDAVAICPHDEADACSCRKPQPGMLLAAARTYGIDLARSFMIGDRWRDIAAGQRAGVSTAFIDRHYTEPRPNPPADFTAADLQGAVSWILKEPSHAVQ
jgi:D-glycero-D-manno-heptose 1,7-bisphosphate phosphatase